MTSSMLLMRIIEDGSVISTDLGDSELKQSEASYCSLGA
jgi:hypothetical protein